MVLKSSNEVYKIGSSITCKNCCLTCTESSMRILVFSQRTISMGKMKCVGFSLEVGLRVRFENIGKKRHPLTLRRTFTTTTCAGN